MNGALLSAILRTNFARMRSDDASVKRLNFAEQTSCAVTAANYANQILTESATREDVQQTDVCRPSQMANVYLFQNFLLR